MPYHILGEGGTPPFTGTRALGLAFWMVVFYTRLSRNKANRNAGRIVPAPVFSHLVFTEESFESESLPSTAHFESLRILIRGGERYLETKV